MPPRFVVKLPLMEAGHPRSPLRAYLKLARPKQWTKNGFVLAGVDGARVLTASARVAAVKDPRPDSLVRRMPDLVTTIPD